MFPALPSRSLIFVLLDAVRRAQALNLSRKCAKQHDCVEITLRTNFKEMKPEKAELKGSKTHQNLKAYGLALRLGL
jgi:hypothetical protein